MNWNDRAARILKAELVKQGVTHQALADRLQQAGISATRSGVDNKLSRGTFSAAFLVQCMTVLGCREVRLD